MPKKKMLKRPSLWSLKMSGLAKQLSQVIRYILGVCVYSNCRRHSLSGSAVRNHWRTHPAPCVHPRCVCCVLHSHTQFCWFGGRHRRRSVTLQSSTATLIPLFSSSELIGCGYPGLLDRKNRSDMCPRWESNPPLLACKVYNTLVRLTFKVNGRV